MTNCVPASTPARRLGSWQMPKYLVTGTVSFAFEAEIDAENEEEARDTVEREVLEGEHLDLGANDLGRTIVKEVAAGH